MAGREKIEKDGMVVGYVNKEIYHKPLIKKKNVAKKRKNTQNNSNQKKRKKSQKKTLWQTKQK